MSAGLDIEDLTEDIGECPECGSGVLTFHPMDYQGGPDGAPARATETITCEDCGVEYRQTWELQEREKVDQ